MNILPWVIESSEFPSVGSGAAIRIPRKLRRRA
jgi:hypothetical protein